MKNLWQKEYLMTGKMRLQKVDKLCLRGYLSVCGLSPASYPLLYTYRKCAGMPEAFTGSSFPQHTAVSLCGAGPGRGADVTARRLCWKKRPEHKRSGRFLGWIKGLFRCGYSRRAHSASLKPVSTRSSRTTSGRLTSIPSVASSRSCSSSLIPSSRSRRFIAL